MGVSPKHWGKEGWRFIHWVALTYPNKPTDKDREKYLKFFESLQDVLPCGICAEHFRKNMETHPIMMGSNKELFDWTVDMHNIVNKQNGKKILTYDQAFTEITKQDKPISDDLLKGIAFSSALITIITLLSKKYVNNK